MTGAEEGDGTSRSDRQDDAKAAAALAASTASVHPSTSCFFVVDVVVFVVIVFVVIGFSDRVGVEGKERDGWVMAA